MFTYYNLLIACQLEMDARLDRAGKSAAGGVIGTKTAELNTAYLSVIQQLGKTKAGNKTGELSRKASTFIAELPFLTMPADAIRHANCLDLLTENVRTHRDHARPLVQLAEAYEITRRQILMTRGFRAVLDPSSVLVNGVARALTTLGGSHLSPAQRLVRRTHRTATAGTLGYEELLALARAYRLAGRPGLASHYAARALQYARSAQAALPPPQKTRRRLGTAWEQGFSRFWQEMAEATGEAAVRIAAGYTGEFGDVDDRTLAALRVGAAWVALAWAYTGLGDLPAAERAARAAIDAGFTTGYEVLAATYRSSAWFGEQILERNALLSKISRRDWTFYHGAYRGDLRIGGAVLATQYQKTKKLLT